MFKNSENQFKFMNVVSKILPILFGHGVEGCDKSLLSKIVYFY